MDGAAGSAGVRLVRPEDAEAWRSLWDAYLAFYREVVPEEVTRTTFARLCDGEEGMVGLVAVDDHDQPIGIAHLVFHSTTWRSANTCYLEDLYVQPGHRGGSVSVRLFDSIYAEARGRGASTVYWHTQQYNGRARSLYDTVAHVTPFIVYEHVLD